MCGWRYWGCEKAVAYYGVAVGASAAGVWCRWYGVAAVFLFGQGESAQYCGQWLLRPREQLHGCHGVAGVHRRCVAACTTGGCLSNGFCRSVPSVADGAATAGCCWCCLCAA